LDKGEHSREYLSDEDARRDQAADRCDRGLSPPCQDSGLTSPLKDVFTRPRPEPDIDLLEAVLGCLDR
jgi:hypothetical protein